MMFQGTELLSPLPPAQHLQASGNQCQFTIKICNPNLLHMVTLLLSNCGRMLPQVWKVLLGVLPRHTSSTEWVWQQRAEQYLESERALTLTRKIGSSTSPEMRATLVLSHPGLGCDFSQGLADGEPPDEV